ncbi:MAG: hypothetical protein G3M78_06450 [Candidatus Nitrohelix vancouverensis]|uniref:NHL repeat containing protein n=1 Tax=Candidatus Nitrohelix vancouverensis TaxID=2705534 RepID=A0A7T0C290_9BACT|nr:MAG: hypothetical protein G3M78_06450 [Candidatus Nitrohelix vancouverensis]
MSEDEVKDGEAENENEDKDFLPSQKIDDLDEVLEEDELDEIDEVDEQAKPERGAYMVLGQGDFSVTQANRGADDPGDNTLCEPQYITKYGEMLFASDRGNHRVLIWDQFPEEDGEPASVVLGQEDFADCLENRGMTTTLDEMTSGLGDESLDGFTISKCEEDTLSQPADLAVIDGKLYVVDSGNHRVLRWSGLPSDDGEPPSMVLGQDNMDCNEANRRSVIGSGSLFFPMGICSGDDQHVFVADKDNHRVLMWKKIPFGDGWNADICLGQLGMDEREPNRGDFDNVESDTMSFPTGVHYDAEEDKLFVVDQGNNRVLIWNKLPRENGQPADLVLGQKDFQSRDVNMGAGSNRANAGGMYFPTDVVYGRNGLFVSDTSNNRVLYWKELPTENGQPADRVFGQTNFYDNKPNRFGEASSSTLNDPYGLHLEEGLSREEAGLADLDDEPIAELEGSDDFDDDEVRLERRDDDEDDEDNCFRLYISDRGNCRIVVWRELPLTGLEVKEEEAEMVIDAPDTLIGEDDEDDDYFSEESEEEEVPAV